jgi:hypothetical protein
LCRLAVCIKVHPMQNTLDLLVRKDRITETTLRAVAKMPLAQGAIRVSIDKFALTSNNITYAAFGDAMNYWQFFPVVPAGAEEVDADTIHWGRIPVWGFGSVTESNHPQIAVGERLYGYFPMSNTVDLTPDKLSTLSFMDSAPHRAALHPVYNQYTRTAADPFYTPESEDVQALLRPLFITSWLIDDFLADNAFFGVTAQPGKKGVMLLSSASSKTAYGTAFQMAQRNDIEVVGFTSPGNVAFCESLGCYQRVLTYDQLDQIAADTPCVYVDFAGNAAFRRAVHTHCTGLAYSSSIGGTHVDALGGGKDIPGPKPSLFFAPAQIKKRSAEWGPQGLGQYLVKAWQAFLLTATRTPSAGQTPWITVQHHTGSEAVQSAYLHVLGGKGDPRVGHILSL